jgi:hypothetical protein
MGKENNIWKMQTGNTRIEEEYYLSYEVELIEGE